LGTYSQTQGHHTKALHSSPEPHETIYFQKVNGIEQNKGLVTNGVARKNEQILTLIYQTRFRKNSVNLAVYGIREQTLTQNFVNYSPVTV
jgi:hypothetical protein